MKTTDLHDIKLRWDSFVSIFDGQSMFRDVKALLHEVHRLRAELAETKKALLEQSCEIGQLYEKYEPGRRLPVEQKG